MRQLHERLPIHDDAPTPEQLFRLASRSVVLAKQYRKLRTAPHARAHSHFMMPPSEVIVPDIFEAPFGYRFERAFSARIARTGFRAWSMRLLSTYQITEMGSERGAERHTYSFEWNHANATLAHHRLRIIPTPEHDLMDSIDHFEAKDDIAYEWSMRAQMQQMSSGDVKLLTQDVEALMPEPKANFTAA